MLGPAANIRLLTPSEIVTLPVLLFLAKLTVIAVPGGNTLPKVIATTGFKEFTVVLFVPFATVPAGESTPTELAGLTPPEVEITLPDVGTAGAVI